VTRLGSFETQQAAENCHSALKKPSRQHSYR